MIDFHGIIFLPAPLSKSLPAARERAKRKLAGHDA
jgi:hypothetical protein